MKRGRIHRFLDQKYLKHQLNMTIVGDQEYVVKLIAKICLHFVAERLIRFLTFLAII